MSVHVSLNELGKRVCPAFYRFIASSLINSIRVGFMYHAQYIWTNCRITIPTQILSISMHMPSFVKMHPFFKDNKRKRNFDMIKGHNFVIHLCKLMGYSPNLDLVNINYIPVISTIVLSQ